MFVYNLDPVLLHLGPLEIRYYGLVYALGLLFAYGFLNHLVKKGRIANLTQELLDVLILYLAGGLILGGRLGYFLFYARTRLVNDPLALFRVWEGGMSFHGALLGLMLVLWLFTRKYDVKFYAIADVLVIPTALGLFFGRIANFINGELIGTPTTVSWCIQYKGVEGCRHPSQLYEAGKNLFIFFMLWYLYAKRRLKEGILFWTFVLAYGVLRFFVTFYREDPRVFGLSEGQILSALMAFVALYFLVRIQKKH
ncbi:MAG: prolipoprotein diacylglyceryl transferase [DPANN group archaeon]|nr:prolipoprotein diacylglyceryl transferase [DPANN group archaeon]